MKKNNYNLDYILSVQKIDTEIGYNSYNEYINPLRHQTTIDNDINRADDGKHLRYEFASERSYSNYYPIDNRPCSVLEMLIALAIRINDEIMWNPDYGDKTAAWFWEMIDNLGLGNLDDYCF